MSESRYNWRSSRGGGRWNRGSYGTQRQQYRGRGWQQNQYQSPSPYSHQFQQQSQSHPPAFNPHDDYSPHYKGGHGRGRFSNQYHETRSDVGIEAWVSPAMWDDPWKEFTTRLNDTSTYERTLDEDQADPSATKFATLGVSDMMMQSNSHMQESRSEVSPKVSIDLKDTHEIAMKDKTEESFKNQDGKDLMTVITS